MSKKNKMILMTVGFISLLSSSAFANLTGRWICNDGGSYYIRQVGSEVFWYGEKSPTSPTWANIGYGSYSEGNLVLRWGAAPKGINTGSGILIITVSSDENKMTAVTKTGDFEGSSWKRQAIIR